MSDNLKTFRLGGAAGYSVRVAGYAAKRRGGKPAYSRVQLVQELDTGEHILNDEPLGVAELDVGMFVNGLPISDENKRYLSMLLHVAWRRWCMS